MRQHQAYAAQQSRGRGLAISTYGGGTMHVYNERSSLPRVPAVNQAPKARLHSSASSRRTELTKTLSHPLAHFFVAESTRAVLRRRMELRYTIPNPADPSVAELPQIVNDE
eukprot:COSAG01_NODE_7532_length_3163_cov_51.836815_3_plen_111_part_00